MAQRILIVEDDPLMRNIMQKVLATAGYDVTTASDGYEAIAKVKEQTFELIVSDVRMPGMDGLETMAQVKQLQPAVRSVVVTAFADEHAPVRAVNLGVDAYLYKPFEMKDFLDIIKRKVGEPEKGTTVSPTVPGMGETAEMIAMVKAFVGTLGLEKALEVVKQTATGQSNPKLVDLFHRLYPETEKKTEFFLKRASDLIRLGSTYLDLGQNPVARQGFEEALALAKAHGDVDLQVEALLGLALAARGNVDEAIRCLDQASALSSSATPCWEGQVELVRGRLLDELGHPKEAAEHLAQAEKIFRQWGDMHQIAQALLHHASIEMTLKREDEAMGSFRNLLELAKEYPLFRLFYREAARMGPLLVMALRKNLSLDIVMAVFKQLGPVTSELMQPLLEDPDPAVRRVAREIYSSAIQEKVSHLRVHCFGKVRIFTGSAWVPDNALTAPERELLAYLLLHDQVSLGEMANLLWPGLSTEEERRREARIALDKLRQLLEPYLRDPSQSTYILSQGDVHWFNRERNLLCDLVAFQEEWRAGEELDQAGKPAEAIQRYAEAERCYGGPFLDGHDSAWVLEYRDRYRTVLWTLLSRIVGHHGKSGAFMKGVPYARKMLAGWPEREEGYLALTRLLWGAGKRNEAQAVLEQRLAQLGPLSREFQEVADAMTKGDPLPGIPAAAGPGS